MTITITVEPDNDDGGPFSAADQQIENALEYACMAGLNPDAVDALLTQLTGLHEGMYLLTPTERATLIRIFQGMLELQQQVGDRTEAEYETRLAW